MGKQWGSCVMGIFLSVFIIAIISNGFWRSLDRGTLNSVLVLLSYFGVVVGAVAALGTALWGYGRLAGAQRPIVHHLWGATLVVIAFTVLIGFLKTFLTLL
jgi:hypothetical protein